MMRNVKILLSGKTNLQYYTDALQALGALADAKYLPKVDTGYDGLLLCGGGDVHPKYYHAPIGGSENIDEARDAAEFALIEAYLAAGKPMMGICRGHQVINVFFGGSLYQHLPHSEQHTNHSDLYIAHEVAAVGDSVVGRLYGTSFSVNSSHHQAIKTLGAGLAATAMWQDRYVEAIEHTTLPVIGVQWHPERMCFGQKREDTVDGSLLLAYFLDMCKHG